MMGVSAAKARGLCNPHPWALTRMATQFSAKGRTRSRLVTVTGISTRMRVLRRVALGVCTSMLLAAMEHAFGWSRKRFTRLPEPILPERRRDSQMPEGIGAVTKVTWESVGPKREM